MDVLTWKFISTIIFSVGTVFSPASTASVHYLTIEGTAHSLAEIATIDTYAHHDGLIFDTITFEITENETTKGTFEVDINRIRDDHTFEVNDLKVEILQYYPDYYLNENNEPDSKTNHPFNPAFVIEITGSKDKELIFIGVTGIEVYAKDDPAFHIEILDVTSWDNMEI